LSRILRFIGNRIGRQNTLNPTENSINFDGLLLAKQALSPVSEEIETLLQKIPLLIPCETKVAKRMMEQLFSNPGKMIRPALYYLTCKLVGYDGPHKHTMAAVSEFVHTASLLHDDVIDCSTLRRNKPTMNSIWGDESAVLFGDLIYARASELMAQTTNLEIVSSFARSIRLMSESELLQLESVFDFYLPEDVYMKILFGKTAVLIGTTCKSAGLLANSTPEQLQSLEEFGLNIGIAFQLVDDALDFLGEDRLLGKKNFGDLQEGKITLPLILLREHISKEEQQSLDKLYKQGLFSHSEITQICQLVEKYKTAEKTLDRARDLTHKSLTTLRNNFLPSEERSNLEALAMCLSFRTF